MRKGPRAPMKETKSSCPEFDIFRAGNRASVFYWALRRARQVYATNIQQNYFLENDIPVLFHILDMDLSIKASIDVAA